MPKRREHPEEFDASPTPNKVFALTRRAARTVLRRRMRLFLLARATYRKLAVHGDAVSVVRDDLLTLARLARNWAKREYRSVPWRSLLYAVMALLYFVNPADVIPDVLLSVGFVDDVAVVGAIVHAIHNDLARFRSWEEKVLVPEMTTDD